MFKKIASMTSLGSEPGTGLLRAARSGNLEKVLEYLNTVDINTSNANGLNALHLASKDGHVTVVQELLKRGADVNSATKKGNTSLHISALAGQEEVVKLLVESGANVNVQSQNGFTPLYMASQENHDTVVQFLLSNGANQALATEDGFTPLAVAMQQGHDKVVSLLLSHDSRGKARLPALHIAAKKNDLSAAGLLLMSSPTPDLTSKSNFTPLHIAAHYGNAQVATLLLDKGADVNFRAKHQITPLHVAAKWGKSAVAGLLIERGADVGGKTRDGLTPLHCASRSGHEQLVDLLVEKGGAIGAKTKNGLTPLHMSAQGDHVPSARILLFHKAPVDDVTVDYLTPLHVSAHCGHVRVAKLLLDKKADPNSRALNGFTPLHIACKKNRIKVVELLLQHGASIEASTESGLTPLHVASFMGCMNISIFLLQNGAEVEARTVRGETPLHLAARANQTDIVRILLRNGASVDSKAKEEQTPLHIAARLGNSDLVMLLLQHGANPDDRTKEQLTAVHISAKEGQEEVLSLLLDHGAAPAPETSRGFTPLHLASKNGHAGVAKLLIAKGAPPNAVGRNGLTPLHVATSHGHPQIATILLDAGADPRAATKNGHTPLHIAGKKNQIEIGSKLIPNSDVNARSKAGFTPVHIAAMEGNLEFVKMLIGHGAETSPEAENHLTPLHLAAQEDRVGVADTLRATGVQIDPRTAAGYTPLHIASHFGHSGMVKFLVQNGADIQAHTNYGNTPLHHASQQGQAGTVNVLLEKGAEPDALNSAGQTPLAIASKLNYVSVVESLRRVTKQESTIDKYKVVLPETMLEGLASDSEDEGVDEPEAYRYLTVDDMKSLGDDSMPMDVEGAMDDMEEIRTTGAASELSMSQPGVGFLVSFMVDARGGAMRGCRHSGIRVVIPPLTAPAPTRITCKYLRKERLAHPPPLMEGEALASRILELGPGGVKFLGKVTIEVPHFACLRTGEREIVVLRSEDGVTWREHTSDPESEQQVKELEANRLTRITTTEFPQYFALVSRIKQEVHAVGPEGGVVSSSVVKEVTATFPAGALTKRIRVGIQAHPIPTTLVTKHGSKLSVSPIVTVEPRRRKFHKPISLSIPLPASKDPNSSLRLLCSITGGSTRAQWEDVTGSTPLTFINDHVSFTTTVSARFWLIDSRQGTNELTRLATEIYREAIVVPFMAKFLVYAKRIDTNEARLRVFCMTDDREDKTLEGLENFTEVAKSKDVEVFEGKPQYLEMAGNLNPVTKSGEQLRLKFYAFRENRLGLLVRQRDSNAGGVGRIVFRREPKGGASLEEVPPTVNLNISLPIDILPDEPLSQPPSCISSPRLPFNNRYGQGLRTAVFGMPQQTGEIHKADLRLSDVANLLGQDWRDLAVELGVGTEDIAMIADEYAESPYQQATVMLRLWMQQAGDRATGNNLEKALNRIHREDIVEQCIGSLDRVTDLEEQIIAKTQIESTKTAEKGRNISYDEEDIMKDSESIEDVSQVEAPKPGIVFSPMATSYETEEVKYGPEEKEIGHTDPLAFEQQILNNISTDSEMEPVQEAPMQVKYVVAKNFVSVAAIGATGNDETNYHHLAVPEDEIQDSAESDVDADRHDEQFFLNTYEAADRPVEDAENYGEIEVVEETFLKTESGRGRVFATENDSNRVGARRNEEEVIEELHIDEAKNEPQIESSSEPEDNQQNVEEYSDPPAEYRRDEFHYVTHFQVAEASKLPEGDSSSEPEDNQQNVEEYSEPLVEYGRDEPQHVAEYETEEVRNEPQSDFSSEPTESQQTVEEYSDIPEDYRRDETYSYVTHFQSQEVLNQPQNDSSSEPEDNQPNAEEYSEPPVEFETDEIHLETDEVKDEPQNELDSEPEYYRHHVEVTSELPLHSKTNEIHSVSATYFQTEESKNEPEHDFSSQPEYYQQSVEDVSDPPEENKVEEIHSVSVTYLQTEESKIEPEHDFSSEPEYYEQIVEDVSDSPEDHKIEESHSVSFTYLQSEELKSESDSSSEPEYNPQNVEEYSQLVAEIEPQSDENTESQMETLQEEDEENAAAEVLIHEELEDRSSAESEETGQDIFPESRFKAAFDEDSSRAASASPVAQLDEDEVVSDPEPYEVRDDDEIEPEQNEGRDDEEMEPDDDEVEKNLATTAAVQLIAEIEERVEERLQVASGASSAGVTPTDDPTPKVSTDSKQSSAGGVVGSSSVSFFTAREERSRGLSEERPKSSDSSTLAFISSSEYQTPGSLTESQSTLGEDEPVAGGGGFSKGITCDLGTITSLPVTLTSSTAGTSAACAVSQESTFESRISRDADEPNEAGNFPVNRHHLDDIEEELLSSTPKGSIGSTNDDKFKRPASSSSSSLNEFEKLESAVLEEFSKDELLSEIEEGQESQTSEATEVTAGVEPEVEADGMEIDWKDLLEEDELRPVKNS